MARFILEYDVALESATKGWLLDNVNVSMVSPNGDSAQFCLEDVLNKLKQDYDFIKDLAHNSLKWDKLDYIYLDSLLKEGVNYIEICF
jgi:hypothetical protein